MKRLIAVALAFACLALARQARADSDVFFLQMSSTTSSAVSISTASAISHPVKYFSLQVKGSTTTAYASHDATAIASSWDVRLEGSNDGVHYTKIMEHASGDGDADGSVKASTNPAAAFPVTWIRTRVNALSLGSLANGITVTAIGSQ